MTSSVYRSNIVKFEHNIIFNLYLFIYLLFIPIYLFIIIFRLKIDVTAL